MADTQDLSLAFLESHPADAARVLEQVAPADVGALLAEAPMRLAGPVLRAMLPLHAARCLDMLADDMVSGMLRAIGPQSGVAILHHLPESRRSILLAQLPTALAVAYRLLLGYPEDTVGAWMNPRVIALPPETPLETVLARLREAEDLSDAGVFVVGPGQRLLGQADLRALLHAPASATLARAMRGIKHTLPARTSIRAVEEHEGWEDHQMLAVVERDERFVGALDRGVLARVLNRDRRTEVDGGYADVLASVTGTYWSGVSSLIQLAVSLLPVSPSTPAPSKPYGESHDR